MNTVISSFEKGPWNGFKFHSPEATSLQDAIDHYGESTVLTMLNSWLAFNYRTKAKRGLPEPTTETPIQALVEKISAEHPDHVVLGPNEALTWKPFSKEVGPEKQIDNARARVDEINKILTSGAPLDQATIDSLNSEKAVLKGKLLELLGL